MKIKYTPYRPSHETAALLNTCVAILDDYTAQGYRLTLRQLYYQLVSRDVIPNDQNSYDRLGAAVSRAREAGMIDWHHIEDRTRSVTEKPHWENGSDFLTSVAPQFNLDLWRGQERRVIVFVEKEALAQIVEVACEPLDVPYLSNRGYLSASAAWSVGHNTILQNPECDDWLILHLGDHDPSGIDMTRDITERVRMFATPYEDGVSHQSIEVKRIALNRDQIDQYDPPPNPAKVTDSRFAAYRDAHGSQSWELDALPPQVIADLIRDEIGAVLDRDLFDARQGIQTDVRGRLIDMAANFTDEN